MQQSLTELAAQFKLDGLDFVEHAPGYRVIKIENSQASAEIALQGAQVMNYKPAGQEAPVIWLSPGASFKPGKSLRGGVPVCWPWFGPHAEDSDKPAHGYARTVDWRLLDASHQEDDSIRLTLGLLETEATQLLWPHVTPLQLEIQVGASLGLRLTTHNAGNKPVQIGEALHTYFAVSDIADIEIQGLEGATFYDKVNQMVPATQQGPIKIGSEVDRVYVNTHADCVIVDPGYQRRIRIIAPDSQSTIVWNPWQEKAEKMGDLGENGYRRMVCVESGNALENCIHLPQGESHALAVEYRVE